MNNKFFVLRDRLFSFCDDMLNYKYKFWKTGTDYVPHDYNGLLKRVYNEELKKAVKKGDKERIKFIEELILKLKIEVARSQVRTICVRGKSVMQ